MRIMIEIQILRVPRTRGEDAHGAAALQNEARAFRAPIEASQQPLLECVANFGESGHAAWLERLRWIASFYDAIRLIDSARPTPGSPGHYRLPASPFWLLSSPNWLRLSFQALGGILAF